MSGSADTIPGFPAKRGKHAKQKELLACSTVTTLGGQTYTVAQLGGGSQLDIESSAYANCDVGIYISAADGPDSLNQTVVNGVFEIGVYLDGTGTKINQTSICVNGSNKQGNCESGSSSSPGTGIYAQNAPNLSVNQMNVDGYEAGFATSPCPNNGNNLSINQSTVTNSTYPWSFQGGKIKTNHDSPTPPAGGSCAGSGVGGGVLAGGDVYVADQFNNAVKEILAPGYTTVSTLGSGFHNPAGVAVDGSGNVYVADQYNNAVKEILAPDYTTVNTLGSGFFDPAALAVDGSGNVYVADTQNNAIKEILAPGYTTINTLGSGFHGPSAIALDASGNVFVGDTDNSAVKEIVAAGGYTTVNTLGSGFSYPYGIAVDGSGNVYVGDTNNNAVKEIVAASGYTTVNTLGSGFTYPLFGVAVDASGDVYVADGGNNTVYEMQAVGGSIPPSPTIVTLGSGFNYPTGVALQYPAVGPNVRRDHRRVHTKQ